MALPLDAASPVFRETGASAAAPEPRPRVEGGGAKTAKDPKRLDAFHLQAGSPKDTASRGSGSAGWATTADGRRHLAELGARGNAGGGSEEGLGGPQ